MHEITSQRYKIWCLERSVTSICITVALNALAGFFGVHFGVTFGLQTPAVHGHSLVYTSISISSLNCEKSNNYGL